MTGVSGSIRTDTATGPFWATVSMAWLAWMVMSAATAATTQRRIRARGALSRRFIGALSFRGSEKNVPRVRPQSRMRQCG